MIRVFLMILLLLTVMPRTIQAQNLEQGKKLSEANWKYQTSQMSRDRALEKNLGWSYVISGGIGFLGGLAGQQIAKDPFEKGAYTVFQSIGIAAIGYGLYRTYVGSDDQNFFRLIDQSDLTIEQKDRMFRAYQAQKLELEKNEKRIRALTHGLIALLNINSAAQQDAGVVKDSLYFIGGVNLLACASYTWEF